MSILRQFGSGDLEVNQPNGDQFSWCSCSQAMSRYESVTMTTHISPLARGSGSCPTSMNTKQLFLQFTKKLWTEFLYMSLLGSSILLVEYLYGRVCVLQRKSVYHQCSPKEFLDIENTMLSVFMSFICVYSLQMISELPTVRWMVLVSTAYPWITFLMWFQIRVNQKWCCTTLGK